jgi:hypothetical protein
MDLNNFTPFKKQRKTGARVVPAVAAINPRGHIIILEPAVKQISEVFPFTSEYHMAEIGIDPVHHKFIIIKVLPIQNRTSNSYKLQRLKGKQASRGIYLYCTAFLKAIGIFTQIRNVPIDTHNDESGNYIVLDIDEGIVAETGQKYGSQS